MKIGDKLELTIDDIGSNGEGIAHHEGCTVFVPFALTGERVSATVTYTKKNLVYTVLTGVLLASPNRVKPACPIYANCGGCDIMHLSYPAQLESKRNSLITVLRKNCGYTGEVLPTVPSPQQFYYRNKIQLPFGVARGKTVLGFYKPGTHQLVPLTSCFLHGDWADKLIKTVSDFVNAEKLAVYDEATQKGLLRHLVARYVGGALVVTLVINGRSVRNVDALTHALKAVFPDVSLYLSVNMKRTNVILGEELLPVYAPPQSVEIMGVRVEINPLSFFQVNDGVRELIYSAVVRETAPSPSSVVIDAYSGVGLLGAIIAKSGARIYNIEIVSEAVADAKKLYAANGLEDKAVNICGDAAVELPKLISSLAPKNDLTVILDPPRKGCDPAVLEALAAHPADKLLYISCNPATLSRDLVTLLSAYSVVSITPYDMFPNTQHLETLVCMTHKSKIVHF